MALIAAVSQAAPVPVIASGGAAGAAHLAAAFRAGADAALVASLVHDGKGDMRGLKRALTALGLEVRS